MAYQRKTLKFVWAHKARPDGDPWTSTCPMPDKWEHFAAGYSLTLSALVLFAHIACSIWAIPLIALFLAILWEIKDAYLNPWNGIELPFHLTGDGFSWKDMIASQLGVLVALSIFLLGKL
jgi:hypothetical protein